MMNIVFVSKLFKPSNKIGSIRTTNIVKYLCEKYGHHVFCVTENKNPLSINGCEHFYCGFEVQTNNTNSVSPSKKNNPKKKRPLFKRIKRVMFDFKYILSEKRWAKKAEKIIGDICSKNKIDCVIVSYGPLSSVYVGLWAIRNNIKTFFDIRDQLDSSQQSFASRKKLFQLQKKIIVKSTGIITVSNDLSNRYKQYCVKKGLSNNKIKTIFNGFESFNPKSPVKKGPESKLSICYTGSLYNGVRDLTALFDAFNILSQRGFNIHDNFSLHYAGGDFCDLINQNKYNSLNVDIIDHGYLDFDGSQSLQEQSDILCVATWNTKNDKGILTGKFFEYLRLCKPILSFVSGTIKNSELSRIMDDLEIGFSFEYIDGSIEKLADWLVTMLTLKKAGAQLIHCSQNKILNYSYENLIKEYNDFLLSILR